MQDLSVYGENLGDIDVIYNHALVLDNLMLQAKERVVVSKLFTQGRHRKLALS